MKKVFTLVAIAAAFLAIGFTAQPSFAVGSVAGVVIDADGNGVAGAAVMLQGMQMRRGERPFMGRAESGEDGSFNFADVPAGRYIASAMVRELGGARAELAVNDDNVTEISLQLQGRRGGGGGHGGGEGEERGIGSMQVTVVDGEGSAIEGARVIAMPARMVNHRGGPRAHRLVGLSDANGQVSFAEVPEGVWTVTAAARGAGAGRARAEVVADQQTDVEIALQERH